MKNITFTKKIDYLGRIVLPKDIRLALSIEENDVVEITLKDRGIYIEKYQPLTTLTSICERYIEALGANCGVPIAICNTAQIVTSLWLSASKQKPITEQLQKYISLQKKYRYSEESPLYLHDSVKQPIDTIFPIGSVENPIGAVVLIHVRNTTSEERSCAKLIANLLTKLMITE